MDIVERLRELDKKGYQPMTGAIGHEAANEIERLLPDSTLLKQVLNGLIDRGGIPNWIMDLKPSEALEKIVQTDEPAEIVCPNCDTALPDGCGGLFRKDGKACLAAIKT